MSKNSKNISTAFRPTTLTYSSPVVDTTNTAPNFFYNAFPDLNDAASDESQSAFPQRAKYNLALDAMFVPSAKYFYFDDIDENYMMSLDPVIREVYTAIVDRHGRRHPLLLPRSPEANQIYYFQSQFELAHKRLAATDYKWAFRTYYLAPFYTTLEKHLVRGQRIKVPLTPNDRRGASQLQRHWKVVVDAFEPTQLLDEAVSLLTCVMSISTEEKRAFEQKWVEAEEAEIPGFTDFYRQLRGKFLNVNAIGKEPRVVIEQVFDYAKKEFFLGTQENISFIDEVLENLREKNQRIFWPSLLGEKVHRGHPQLRMRRDMVLGNAAARISIPEAMQWLMALSTVWDEEDLSSILIDDAWKDSIRFYLEDEENSTYPRITITAPDSVQMALLAHVYIKKADGSEIDFDSNRAPEDDLLLDSIIHYTLFLESIRQQVCTGVGLRCPFWEGSGCCKFRALLQRTYDVTEPWHPLRKQHWQRPPCLE